MRSRTKAWGAVAAGALASLAACLPDLQAALVGDDAGAIMGACGDGVIEAPDEDGGESCDPGVGMFPECTDCRVQCTGSIDEAGHHCYFLAPPTTTYAAAHEACTSGRGHLVTLASVREARIVDGLASESTYWVGLSRTPQLEGYEAARAGEPGLPPPSSGASCSGCFAVGADDAGTFPPEPGADAGDESCIVARGGAWFRASCTGGAAARTTICEREPAGRRAQYCGGPYCTTLPMTAGKKRYILGLTAVSAADAEQFCGAFEGGSLVVLDSPEEREQLVHELSELLPPPLTVWIGLALDTFGGWRWADGVSLDVKPAPWGNAQPSAVGDGRAFLRIREGTYDTQLAYSADPSELSPALRHYVCQRR